jgi:enoyl-CoA hydratase/carnithine racemase
MTRFTYATVLSTLTDDGIRRISLNRPERLNAMNRALVDDVARAFDEANADPSTRSIVFTGEGRAFCAGDDRKDHQHPANEPAAVAAVESIQRASRAILMGDKPVVGAIRGWAAGGGFEWAINCDFTVWADDARAFFPEVSLGVFVTGGVTAILPAMVGLAKAREMLMLGETYTAADLHATGLAFRVVPDADVETEALVLARRLADLPQTSLRQMKRILARVATGPLGEALSLETEATVAGFLDPESTRRITRF